jgi:hypothetical protein
MSDFKTTDYIVGIVRGLLSSITTKKYLFTKPTDTVLSEYIVINALPINADVMQKCYVNVNYHVKDLAQGTPDVTKITSGTTQVMAILKKVSSTSFLIDFESHELMREDALGEHFSNMRFSFKFINS